MSQHRFWHSFPQFSRLREGDTFIDLPDYSKPGSEGALPPGIAEWQWGVTYTVRPELLAPLVPGRQYRINANVRRRVTQGQEFTAYAELYRRASSIISARAAEFAPTVHKWVMMHAWGQFREFVFAVITLGVICPQEGNSLPHGQNAPLPEELTAPGGAIRDMLVSDDASPRRLHEIYSDFDYRDAAKEKSDIAIFSYGEYVPSSKDLDFAPFVERAEHRARLHRDLLYPQSAGNPLTIVRRDWLCATNPDIAVVHIFFKESA